MHWLHKPIKSFTMSLKCYLLLISIRCMLKDLLICLLFTFSTCTQLVYCGLFFAFLISRVKLEKNYHISHQEMIKNSMVGFYSGLREYLSDRLFVKYK